MSINDGGPVHPTHWDGVRPAHHGIKLRDWFASQALVGLIGRAETNDGLAIAKDAYVIADAMLRAREVQP